MKLFVKLILITTIPILSVIFYLYFNLNTQLVNEIKNNVAKEQIIDIDKLNIEYTSLLDTIKNITQIMSLSNKQEFNDVDILHEHILRMMRSVPSLLEVKYISLKGFEKIGIDRKRMLRQAKDGFYFNEKFFQEPLIEDSIYISQIKTISQTDTWSVNIARRVVDINDGSVLGVVLAKFSLYKFQKLLSQKLNDSYAIAIFDTLKNQTLYQSSGIKEFRTDIIFSQNTIVNTIKNAKEFTMFSKTYTNNLRYIVFVEDKKNYLTLNKIITNNIIILIIALLIVFVILMLSVKNILNPLSDLIERIKDNIHEIDPQLKTHNSSKDEVENLRIYYKLFYKTIRNERRKLSELNESLEEKVQKEVELSRKKDLQINEQAKMVSMGNMIGNIAHQWRQPLSVISVLTTSNLYKQEEGILDTHNLKADLNMINEQAQYLSSTIETFRNFIKEKKERRDVILQERIQIALDIVSASLTNHHILIKNSTKNTQDIHLELVVGELSEVLINILNNAKDILLEKEIKEPWVEISLQTDEKSVMIHIEDNGGGIPDDVMPHIFEPYFTTKHKNQGTGLGLHMVYKIITESLHGDIEATNTQNGALFVIKLPLKV